MHDVINLRDYRQRKVETKLYDVLDLMYLEIIQALQTDSAPRDSEWLESCLVAALTDHLTKDFQGAQDLERLSGRYQQFESKLRRSIYHRLAEFQI